MKVVAVHLHNFRRYRGDVTIPVSGLTALIGRNDIGKSSILEALGIFLGHAETSLDSSDLCVHAIDAEVRIGCTFASLPAEVVIDERAPTRLEDEYLLNELGQLELFRVWQVQGGKAKEASAFAIANHPTAAGYDDLLRLKIAQLRSRAADLGVSLDGVDERTSRELRRAIWESAEDLALARRRIPLSDEGTKAVWAKLQDEFPLFALFKADRPSTDQDGEVQDPMKWAVRQALADMPSELMRVKESVQAKALEVANGMLEKLAELDPELGRPLTPQFSKEPRWDSAFSLSLSGEEGIPLNKRGSGFRRLVLLSFFRSEAERRQSETARDVVYAVEEPEASQHPKSQLMIVEALKNLSENSNCQVLLTTHVPGLAGMLPVTSLRHIVTSGENEVRVDADGDGMMSRIADDLGVVPDRRVKAIVCLEGPNDVTCFRHLARLVCAADSSLPAVVDIPEVVYMPLGGATLRDWVTKRYLRVFGVPEFHLYDRGNEAHPKYRQEADDVNARGDRSKALHTTKAEMENYLHPGAILAARGVSIEIDDCCDVPMLAAEAIHVRESSSRPWSSLGHEEKSRKESRAKRWLNDEAAAAMTYEWLQARGCEAEIVGWVRSVAELLR